jgi:hypothetical protein
LIFISESGLLDLTRKAEWDEWYVDHLRIMRTVEGISSAQRFETDTPGFPLSLAMYTVASADVFADRYYLSIRGFGSWGSLIDPAQYHRNLFSGLDVAPRVEADQHLLVADRAAPDPSLGADFNWLECVDLDRSTAFRGIAIVEAGRLPNLDPGVAVYVPRT